MRGFIDGLTAPVKALVVSFLITAVGQGVWGLMVMANLRIRPDIPWCAGAMALILIVLLSWLGGAGWPRSTSEARRRLLRWNPVRPGVFFWALLTGAISMVAVSFIWLVVADLVRLPPNVTPSTEGVPPLTVGGIFVMSFLAAPLSEEAGFRGYAQGMLERAWKWAPAAIVASSAMFALAHFPQGLFLPKLGLYFLAGLVFGTIAYLTNSLFPAMIIHALGDILGFTIFWPLQSAPHRLAVEGGVDATFVALSAGAAIASLLALFAFRRLARMTREDRDARRELMADYAYA
jgi:membrane protease YdiL (CAAX protease family)